MANGTGTYLFADGVSLSCDWVNDLPNGHAIEEHPDGTRYEG
jgi:hypothetical protein